MTAGRLAALRPNRFDMIDANHDGSLSFDGIEANSGTDFVTMDADGDGIVRAQSIESAKAEKGST
jgi:hypothetical protein